VKHRIESGRRLLEDHRDAAAAQVGQRGPPVIDSTSSPSSLMLPDQRRAVLWAGASGSIAA
jgi:hypothetical protein